MNNNKKAHALIKYKNKNKMKRMYIVLVDTCENNYIKKKHNIKKKNGSVINFNLRTFLQA